MTQLNNTNNSVITCFLCLGENTYTVAKGEILWKQIPFFCILSNQLLSAALMLALLIVFPKYYKDCASHQKQVVVGKHFGNPHVNSIRSPEVGDQPVSTGCDEGKANIQT